MHNILTDEEKIVKHGCGLLLRNLTLIYAAVGLYDTHSLNGFFSFSSYVQE